MNILQLAQIHFYALCSYSFPSHPNTFYSEFVCSFLNSPLSPWTDDCMSMSVVLSTEYEYVLNSLPDYVFLKINKQTTFPFSSISKLILHESSYPSSDFGTFDHMLILQI